MNMIFKPVINRPFWLQSPKSKQSRFQQPQFVGFIALPRCDNKPPLGCGTQRVA